MDANDPRWKAASDPGPDPLTYKAMLSEFQTGYRSAQEEASGLGYHPSVAADGLEQSDVIPGAEEVIELLKRVVLMAKGNRGVMVKPERLVGKLSSGLSRVMYNLGKCQGYREYRKSVLR